MKIKVTKILDDYGIGEHEVEDERANYLKRVGAAEDIKHKAKEEDDAEKVEHKAKKEKVENVKHTPKQEK